MRFTLYYDGPLPSAANDPRIKDKHDIRKRLNPQLLQLFRDHPALPKAKLWNQTWGPWPQWGWMNWADPWSEDKAVVKIDDLHFVPLVRESLNLVCELDILFLRPGEPGLMERGARYDIDNRLLTLFDALAIPPEGAACNFAIDDQTISRNDPFFCLLGDDSRITALNVRTDRLLAPADNAKADHIRLIVGVTLKASVTTFANIGLTS